jgi:hypothetical protein
MTRPTHPPAVPHWLELIAAAQSLSRAAPGGHQTDIADPAMLAAMRAVAAVFVRPQPDLRTANALARAVWYHAGGSEHMETKGRLCTCAVLGHGGRTHAQACDLLWQAYSQAVPPEFNWDHTPANFDGLTLPLTDPDCARRLAQAVYLAGGGALYLEDYGRLCFCPARGRGAVHATPCDELWQAYRAAAAAIVLWPVAPPT